MRKLAPILPAPAKTVAVIPTMLVPVVSSTVTTLAGSVLSSAPVVVAPAVSSTVSIAPAPVTEEEQVIPVSSHEAEATENSENRQSDLLRRDLQQAIGLSDIFDSETASEVLKNLEESTVQILPKTPTMEGESEGNKSEAPEQSSSEVDNNTSSEDDSLLLCSETIDSNSGLRGLSPVLESYEAKTTGLTESILVKTASQQVLPLSDLGHETGEKEKSLGSSVQIESEVPSILSYDGIQNESLSFHAAHGVLQHPSCLAKTHELDLRPSQEDKEVERAFSAASIEGRPSCSQISSTDLCGGNEGAGNKETLSRVLPVLPVLAGATHVIENFAQSMSDTKKEENIQKVESREEDTERAEEEQILRSGSVCSESSSDVSTGELIVTGDASELHDSQSSQQFAFSESFWDTHDTNVDILSTTTSSSGSPSNSFENKDLMENAAANVRTSGRKRKPPTTLDLSPSRQVSSWVRGALRSALIILLAFALWIKLGAGPRPKLNPNPTPNPK